MHSLQLRSDSKRERERERERDIYIYIYIELSITLCSCCKTSNHKTWSKKLWVWSHPWIHSLQENGCVILVILACTQQVPNRSNTAGKREQDQNRRKHSSRKNDINKCQPANWIYRLVRSSSLRWRTLEGSWKPWHLQQCAQTPADPAPSRCLLWTSYWSWCRCDILAQTESCNLAPTIIHSHPPTLPRTAWFAACVQVANLLKGSVRFLHQQPRAEARQKVPCMIMIQPFESFESKHDSSCWALCQLPLYRSHTQRSPATRRTCVPSRISSFWTLSFHLHLHLATTCSAEKNRRSTMRSDTESLHVALKVQNPTDSEELSLPSASQHPAIITNLHHSLLWLPKIASFWIWTKHHPTSPRNKSEGSCTTFHFCSPESRAIVRQVQFSDVSSKERLGVLTPPELSWVTLVTTWYNMMMCESWHRKRRHQWHQSMITSSWVATSRRPLVKEEWPGISSRSWWRTTTANNWGQKIWVGTVYCMKTLSRLKLSSFCYSHDFPYKLLALQKHHLQGLREAAFKI